MTLNELKRDVARLGFEEEITDGDLFLASLARALGLIYSDRPHRAILSIDLPKIELLYHCDHIRHRGGETEVLSLKEGALYFLAEGMGEIVIKDLDGERRIELFGGASKIKLYLNGDAELCLSGEYDFYIKDITVYDIRSSLDTADIPEYSDERRVDVRGRVEKFRSICSEVTDKNGIPVDGARVLDGVIYLPLDFYGRIRAEYSITPPDAWSLSDTDTVDVSPECRNLLVFLTASFMWLDDDSDKAQYYMSLYQNGLADLKRYSQSRYDSAYRTNGWA